MEILNVARAFLRNDVVGIVRRGFADLTCLQARAANICCSVSAFHPRSGVAFNVEHLANMIAIDNRGVIGKRVQ